MQKLAYKSNHNVYFSCKYHVLWCPKYRRKVLVEQIARRFEKFVRSTKQKDGVERSCPIMCICWLK